MSSDLSVTIAKTAASPKSVQTDAATVTSQPVADQIAADQYLAAKNAAAASNGSPLGSILRFGRATPPGAV